MSDLERVLRELARLTERLREVNNRKAAEAAQTFQHRTATQPSPPINPRTHPAP